MRLRLIGIGILATLACSLNAQTAKRLAVMSAHGPIPQANAIFAAGEDRMTDSLIAKLAGTPGLAIIDRESLNKILAEQNLQNSDRSSEATAAKIGKLIGAAQIVLVQLVDAKQNAHQENTAASIKTIGTVQATTRARIIDVETGVILAQPEASFQDSAVVTELNVFTHRTKGGGPEIVFGDLWSKATDSLTTDLSKKSIEALAKAPTTKGPSPLVAGIANGNVYINQGTSAGIKRGDRFQVVRMESLGFKDPATGEDMKQKKVVCSLVVDQVNEKNSSGACSGGTPVSGDVAEPGTP